MSRLYINKLADIDLRVLEQMLKASYKRGIPFKLQTKTVAEYIADIPAHARPKFDALHLLVRWQN